MFKTIAVALLASTLISAPVLAQSTIPSAGAPATRPMTTAKPTIGTTAKIAKVTKVKKHKVKKVKVAKHANHAKHAKHVKPVRHAKPVKHAPIGKHIFHATTKQTMPSHNN